MNKETFLKIAEALYNIALDASDCSDWYGVNLTFSFDEYLAKAGELFDTAGVSSVKEPV
jgi:hypothetical protein